MQIQRRISHYAAMAEGAAERLRSAADLVLDWFYPPHCYHCGAVLSGSRSRILCPPCHQDLVASRIDGTICRICGLRLYEENDAKATCANCLTRVPDFDVARALFSYAGPAGSLIVGFKFHNEFFLGPLLLKRALKMGWTPDGLGDFDAVVPVPLHPRRERERGYNQALLLAKVVARHFERPLRRRALCRTRHTSQQTKLAAHRRWENVRGAFQTNADVRGARLLLVDDVMTTGATASECARVLKKAGARSVSVLTIARTQP